MGTSPKNYNQPGQQAHLNQYSRSTCMSQHQDRQQHFILTRTHKVHQDGSNGNLPSPPNSPVGIHHPMAEDPYSIPTSNRFESLAGDEEVLGEVNSGTHLHREPLTNHAVTSPKYSRPTNHRAIPCRKTLQMHHYTPVNSMPKAGADRLPLLWFSTLWKKSTLPEEQRRGQESVCLRKL